MRCETESRATCDDYTCCITECFVEIHCYWAEDNCLIHKAQSTNLKIYLI